MSILDLAIELNVERLRKHGIVSMMSSVHGRDAILFINGHNRKVTNVFFETEPGHLFNAFTTGDIALNDNFDPSPDGRLIENCVFGAMKTLLERYGWDNHPEFHFDPSWALKFTNNLTKADEEIVKIANKKGITTGAVLQRVHDRAYELSALKATLSESLSVNAAAENYFRTREDLLQDIATADPRLGKLGLGRTAIFDLIKDQWDHTHTGTVFFTRRYILSKHPEVAYLFCLLHKFADTAEVSTDDDLWAVKVASSGGSLDIFYPNISNNAIIERGNTMTDIVAKQPKRLLGVANQMVARSLMGLPLTPEWQAKVEHTANVLNACGWVKWFHTHVYPGEQTHVFDPAPLSEEALASLHNATCDDVKAALMKLVSGLRPE
jgi:hypothetical protein